MNIGRVHAGLAAIGARPLRLRAYQTNAGTAGVVMYFPLGGEEGVNVLRREKIRRAVRAVNDVQLPFIADGRLQVPGNSGWRRVDVNVPQWRCKMQHIAGAQCAAAVATELSQREGGFGTQII